MAIDCSKRTSPRLLLAVAALLLPLSLLEAAPVPQAKQKPVVPGVYLIEWGKSDVPCLAYLYADGAYQEQWPSVLYVGTWRWDASARLLSIDWRQSTPPSVGDANGVILEAMLSDTQALTTYTVHFPDKHSLVGKIVSTQQQQPGGIKQTTGHAISMDVQMRLVIDYSKAATKKKGR